ncbi:mitochondrial carrier protein, putative [Plasmodium vinckei]|uniref:Mitochondrial carrier protein, putative n=1 Tax=Plasmodium vinckei TaxID=5860 RepID=A0A6V7TEM7_PLAVN|nr:mitochondrial carrier protein, putative [Plasmodium vinckei]
MGLKNEDANFVSNLIGKYKNIYTNQKDETCKMTDTKENNINESQSLNEVKKRTLNFMVSSSIILCILHPLDTIKTRKQIYKIYKNSYPYYYNNKYNLFYILKNEKIESLYRGLVASLITTGVSHGVFRFIYDTLNYRVFHGSDKEKKAYTKDEKFGDTKNVNYQEKGANRPDTNSMKNGNNVELIEDNKVTKNVSANYNSNDAISKTNKNMNYYILTSCVSSIIGAFFLHPIWLIKTKIECTINLNYKNLNYKDKITNKRYQIYGPKNKSYFSRTIGCAIKLLNASNNMKGYTNFPKNSKKVRYIISNNGSNNGNFFRWYKNNFIYNKSVKARSKYNSLSYINKKVINTPFSNYSKIKKYILHNYILYKYHPISLTNKRQQMVSNMITNLRKRFYKRYILYSKIPVNNNTILRIFKREECKNSLSSIYVYKNYFQFIYSIYKKEKLASFYKGFFASLLLTPHVAIQFFTYEYLTQCISAEYIHNLFKGRNLSVEENTISKILPFIYGVISKYISVVITYPLYTIKMRQQVQMKNFGFLNVVLNIYKTEGVKAYYTGITTHLLRNCLQNGSLFFIFEYLNNEKS